MSEYLSVPFDCLHLLPDDLNGNVAALAEPMAVCVRGTRRAKIELGDRVAVLGAGTIGLLSVLTAREAGATATHRTRHSDHATAFSSSFHYSGDHVW